jgi:hypothetical protein
MGSFLEKGDAIYWEKQARGLFSLFNKIERYVNKHNLNDKKDKEIQSILKNIRHYRNIFREE